MTFRSSKARWPGLTWEPRLREHRGGKEVGGVSWREVGGGPETTSVLCAIKDHRRQTMINIFRDERRGSELERPDRQRTGLFSSGCIFFSARLGRITLIRQELFLDCVL